MDTGMQKHRMTRRLGKFVAALLLVQFAMVFSVQAAEEAVKPLSGGTYWDYSYVQFFGPFPTAEAACKAASSLTMGFYSVAKYTYAETLPSNDPYPDGAYGCKKIGCRFCSYTNIAEGKNYVFGYAFPRSNAVCPAPTANPTVPYTYNAQTGMCERPQVNLIITLSGGSEVEPSNNQAVLPIVNTLPFIATVIDQNTGQPTTNPVQVHISLKVDPTSGGHDHGDSIRQRGGIANVLTCTSDSECWSNPTANGVVVFNFNPTDASGTHTITATCDGCSNTAMANVDVKVDRLWPIPDSGYYALTEDGSSKVIGTTTNHTSNHYLTSAASMKLWRLAADFYDYQIRHGVTAPTLLHLNDASLKWGGVFDLDEDWDEPHAEHRRGTVIDVRANSNSGAIPAADYYAFKQMAKKLQIDPHFEGESTGQHFHLRLLNRKE